MTMELAIVGPLCWLLAVGLLAMTCLRCSAMWSVCNRFSPFRYMRIVIGFSVICRNVITKLIDSHQVRVVLRVCGTCSISLHGPGFFWVVLCSEALKPPPTDWILFLISFEKFGFACQSSLDPNFVSADFRTC